MEEAQKHHLSVVNSSGFPFQIAVAAQIDGHSRTPWQVILKEHPWKHRGTSRDGYADIVLQNYRRPADLMVLECKRQRGDSRWYFLDPRPETRVVSYVYTHPNVPDSLLVQDGEFYPRSEEASFCVIPGEGGGGRPTLERLADELLQCIEALAYEQLRYGSRNRYIPVVVTNAKLFLCSIDPLSISLETGELPEGAEFKELPFVRFRKTLWSNSAKTKEPDSLQGAHRDRERTLIVVSGSGLDQFLEKADFLLY